MPPETIERWDPAAGLRGVPVDWWKYQVFVNGDRQPLAARADAKLGIVELAVMDSQVYNVLAEKRVSLTGNVEIRLKEDFAEAAGGF